MRTVLLNPHVDDFFAEPLHFRLIGRRALKKYSFLLEGLILESGMCWIYLDYRVSTLFPGKFFSKLPFFIRKFISVLEVSLWARINGFSGKITILQVEQIDRSDVLLAFSYKAARGWANSPDLAITNFKAAIYHLSHYFTYTAAKAEYLRQIPNLWLSGDSDIRENAYFQQHFSWYRREILFMPFAVSKRFINRSLPRSSKCVATGSFHDLEKEVPQEAYRDFISFTGKTTYHPLRVELFMNKDKPRIRDGIECLVQPYRQYGRSKGIARFARHFFAAQKKYFAIDIVGAYNKHQFAVVGEECTGFPAIGAFEAMACGTVLIAYPPAYTGYMLIPGEHFLPYDGTLTGLLTVLEKSSLYDLQKIALAGQNYVEKELSSDSAFRKWMNAVERVASDLGSRSAGQ
ncbi:MAG: glycosyltransferase [Burkholderiales bacterium]|jgi:hypothetical protein|nr:glycosyltransferase [Burkholderiales bacterium]